jgi:predicted HicB family RNase H-like nuclease
VVIMTMQRLKKRTGQLVLRVEPELRAELEAAAEEERRPMANLIRNILADWVDGRPSVGRNP